MIEIRNRWSNEIDPFPEGHTDLVQDDRGYPFPAKPEPEPDMSDPRNWPEGCDVLVRDFKNSRWDIRTFIRFASDRGKPFICRSFDEPTACGWRYAKRITIHD